MKRPVVKKVVSERALNSLNFALIERKVVKDYVPHFHDLYEIEFIISGKCIQYINNEAIECTPNSMLFITPMDLHSVTIIEPIQIINLNFDASCIDSELLSFCEKSMYSHNMCDTYIKLLCNEYNSNLEYDLFLEKHLLNCIVAEIIRYAKIVAPQKSSNLSIETARYIQMNYNKNITLGSLSTVFGYTPNYISSQFHQNIGKTVKQFISEVRLGHAAKMLLTTTSSVTDICYDCGFTSLSHFLRAFKNKYNTSPSLYRKNYES